MATLADLLDRFKLNVEQGVETTLTHTKDGLTHLTCDRDAKQGYVGIARIKPKKKGE